MKYILLAFLGIAIMANAQVLNVPEITQEYDQWCWVGVSKCVLDYYGYSHLQCEIAEYTRNVSTWHNFGLTPCCNNALQGCNYWNYNWGEAGSIQDILVHFGNINNNGTGVLSISNIQNNLIQQRPFIIRWGWLNGSGGHFIVGYGIQNNNVYYMDPWFGEGYKISTYENIKNDGWHEWTHTNVLLISPTPIYYIVTFAGEEINIASQHVAEGDLATQPTTPEREGYDFVDWFTDNGTFLNEWNFVTDVVMQDTILYAKWEQKTEILDIEIANIEIYPNPVKDMLRIENGKLSITRIEIADLSGQVIYQFNNLRNQINVSALPQGIYFLKLETDKEIVTKKFVKE
jgi:uncharacterized repeat protein (TIGR02543 family)